MGQSERNHPRVPSDLSEYVMRIAADLRSRMIDRHGDGRIIGWGTANRLLLVHACLMRPEGTQVEQARLDCLRDVIDREAQRLRPEAFA
jgi:hypothetical protein